MTKRKQTKQQIEDKQTNKQQPLTHKKLFLNKQQPADFVSAMRCAGPVRITRCAGFIAIEYINKPKKNQKTKSALRARANVVHVRPRRHKITARAHTYLDVVLRNCLPSATLRKTARVRGRTNGANALRRVVVGQSQTLGRRRTARAKLAAQHTLSRLSCLELKSDALCCAPLLNLMRTTRHDASERLYNPTKPKQTIIERKTTRQCVLYFSHTIYFTK